MIHDLTEDAQVKVLGQAPEQPKTPSKPIKKIEYNSEKPLLQFFEEKDPKKKKNQLQKELMSLTVKTINNPFPKAGEVADTISQASKLNEEIGPKIQNQNS